MTAIDLFAVLAEVRRDQERCRAERLAWDAAHPSPPHDYRGQARTIINWVTGPRPAPAERFSPPTLERLESQVEALLMAGADEDTCGERSTAEVVLHAWWDAAPLRCGRPTSRRGACQNAVEVEGRPCHRHADRTDATRSNGAPSSPYNDERV